MTTEATTPEQDVMTADTAASATRRLTMTGPDPVADDLEGADALTADGGIVTIRPIHSRDREAIAALYAGASPENLQLRFFTQPSAASLTLEVNRLCGPQTYRHLAVL